MNCPECGVEPAPLTGAEASQASTCETLQVTGTAEARGRNGWFSPSEVAVQRSDSDGTISLSVRSSRAYSEMPPIWLNLCREDAKALHRALGRQVASLATIGTADMAVHDE